MLDPASISQLMLAAERDLKVLQGMLVAGSEYFPDEAFGLFAQQALEKSFKTWLALSGNPFPFTHSLRLLLSLLEDAGENVDQWWDLMELSAFAVDGRYSDGFLRLNLERDQYVLQIDQLVKKVRDDFDRKYRRE